MANLVKFPNRVKALRLSRGWSQAELALRADISRAAVSAIEIGRLVPSVAAAISLASALGCSVEELFGNTANAQEVADWAWPPPQEPCRYWHARVGDRWLHYPVEGTSCGVIGHDGIREGPSCSNHGVVTPEATLVVASCDPAAGLLASEYSRSTGFRLLMLPRSSQQALTLLEQGSVHVAGVHLAPASQKDGNARAVKARLGKSYTLLRFARWQEGLALTAGLQVRSVESALRGKLRWVGREPGSGARQCLDELFRDRAPPRRLARDHRGVAEAIRCGWADVGVCLRLTGEEAGLRFLSVREEVYDLCFPSGAEGDPRIKGLIQVVRSASFRRVLGELPGYDTSDSGELGAVN